MHFPTILAGIAALSTAVAAAPKEKPYVGVAIMTYNGDDSTPLNVPPCVLTQDTRHVTAFEIAPPSSRVKGVEAPDVDDLTYQMYKDNYGSVPGIKDFRAREGVIIAD